MKSIIVSLVTALIVIMGIGLMGSGEESAAKEPGTNKEATSEPATEPAAKPKAGPEQYINPIPLPDYLELAGEQVPLQDWDVRERLDKEILVNTYWHSSTIRILKLANRYFPMIEPILAQHGVHDDMKFVALVESGLTNNSVSGAGARGPWQFMSAAAKQFGLEIATEVDERYNWEKSTQAAAKYLKNEYNSLNSWTLAAAAYNAGHGRIKGSLSKQKADNYYDLYLTTETARYVFRILAMKEIYNNQEKYGFFLDSSEKYQPIDTKNIEVTEIGDIPTYAKSLGISYKTFKLLNPWLRTTKLSKRKSGKKYLVKVPY